MTENRAARRLASLDTLVFAGVTAALVVAATLVMFSAFMFYDDEGYVLLSLRNYAEHGGLYRDVYTQYGPFPFVLYHALHTLGISLTHHVGRLITILAWAGTALSCAALARTASRSLLVQIAVLAATFLYLWVMASEPTHPGGIIILLVSSVAYFGYRWIAEDKTRTASVFIGAAIGLLTLTKINIGIFAAFAAGSWWLAHHRSDIVRRFAWLPISLGGAALSLALMRPLLGTPWVNSFVIVFTLSVAAVTVSTSAGASGKVGWPELRNALLTALIVGVTIIALVMVRGTSLADFAEGLVLGPMRQPANFSLRFLWPPGIQVLASLSLAAAAAAFALRNRCRPAVDLAVAILRIVAAVALAVNLIRFPIVSPDYLVFGSLLPCLWLFAWRFARDDDATTAARHWLVFLLAGQCLHVFPVPGSQIAWGSFLVIPLAAIGAWEAGRHLLGCWRIGDQPLRRIQRASAALLIIFTFVVGGKFVQLAARYREGENLGLPGAELIRVPEKTAAMYRVLAHNAVAHADVLFSLPGMFSFNLWTGAPTPTQANVTHWFSLLNPQQQDAIKRELAAHPRAAVIVHREHLNFLAKRNLAPKGELYRYITDEFEPVFTIDDVAFCVHRGRQVQPFLIAEQLTRSDALPAAPAESTLLRMKVLLPPARPVGRIELSATPEGSLLVLNQHNARVEFAPDQPRGGSRGSAPTVHWPLQLPGAGTLLIYYQREALSAAARNAVIILRDPQGVEVGLARLASP